VQSGSAIPDIRGLSSLFVWVIIKSGLDFPTPSQTHPGKNLVLTAFWKLSLNPSKVVNCFSICSSNLPVGKLVASPCFFKVEKSRRWLK